MKHFIWIALLAFAACQQPQTEKPKTPVQEANYKHIGPVKPDPTKAVLIGDAVAKAKETGDATITVKGEVVTVCQKKGCWMSLKNGNEEPIRVRFKDYGFFMPKDISGKNVILSGKFATDTLTVETQKHLAEEEGKSAADMKNIKETKYAYSVVSDGVLIEGK